MHPSPFSNVSVFTVMTPLPPIFQCIDPHIQIRVAALECTSYRYISALRNLPAHAVSYFKISANRKSIRWMTIIADTVAAMYSIIAYAVSVSLQPALRLADSLILTKILTCCSPIMRCNCCDAYNGYLHRKWAYFASQTAMRYQLFPSLPLIQINFNRKVLIDAIYNNPSEWIEN